MAARERAEEKEEGEETEQHLPRSRAAAPVGGATLAPSPSPPATEEMQRARALEARRILLRLFLQSIDLHDFDPERRKNADSWLRPTCWSERFVVLELNQVRWAMEEKTRQTRPATVFFF